MNEDQQTRLQAFFDGELPEAEAREVANWIANDPDATALHKELKHTRQALSGFEAGIAVPESREFYWSKIEREIDRLENAHTPQPEKTTPGWLLRVLFPASAFAIVAITAVLAAKSFGLLGTQTPSTTAEMEMTFADPGAFTYRDDQQGMTVVWLSYGENGLADDEGATIIQ